MSEYAGDRNNGWLTPQWFLDLVRKVAPIYLDPCADTGPGNWTGATRRIVQAGPGLAGCGLSINWSHQDDEQAFINPPYGRHLAGDIEPDRPLYKGKGDTRKIVGYGTGWAKKICQYQHAATVLVPVRTDQEWWHDLRKWADMTLLWKSPEYGSRIRFVHPVTRRLGPSPNMASTVFFKLPIPTDRVVGSGYGKILVPTMNRESYRTRVEDTFGPHGVFIW